RQNLLHDLADTIGIHHFQSRSIQASLKTAAHEGLEEPVVCRVSSLLMLLHGVAIAIQPARDFLGQQLVPKLPTEALRHLSRDHGENPESVNVSEGSRLTD